MPNIDARSPDGNVFVIMGYVRRYLQQTKQLNKLPLVMEAMRSADYTFACDIAEEVTLGWLKITHRPGRDGWNQDYDDDYEE